MHTFTTRTGPAHIDPAKIDAANTLADGSTAVYFGTHRVEVVEPIAAVLAAIDGPATPAKPAKPAKK